MKSRYLPLAAAIVALLAACKPAPVPDADIRPVRTQTLKMQQTQAMREYAGEIRSRLESPLGFKVGGRVVERLVQAGTMVKTGQALARLDPQDFSLELSAKQAQLAAAQSDLQQQQTDLVRYRGLLEQQFISQADFDRRANGVNVAREKVRQAQADLGVSGNRREDAVLRSPHDGVVTQISLEVGQVLAAGQVVAKVAVPSAREIAVNIPEGERQALLDAKQLRVQLWAGQREYVGRLRELSPEADPVTRTYAARVAIEQADDAVRLGMSARLLRPVEAASAHAWTLPLTAILDTDKAHSVWVLEDKTLTVHKKPVTLGQINADTIQVSGLNAGDEVVTAGVHLLHEGQKVLRLNPQPTAGQAALAAPTQEKP